MKEIYLPRVAILASGGGSTADAYAEAIHAGLVHAEIGLVVSSDPNAGILDRVDRWNSQYEFDTETCVINDTTHPGGPCERGQTFEESLAIAALMDEHDIDIVALLGYMRIVNGPLIDNYGYLPDEHRSMYEARMINTHPGPLPETKDTYGMKTSQRVLDEELSVSKHTVHVVSAGVDEGPKIAEHPVPVHEDDTAEKLNARTQLIEKATIAYAIDKFITGQREWHARRREA